MSRILSYLLGLLCIGVAFPLGSQSRQDQPRALRVFLGKTCPDNVENSRLLAVRYLTGGRYYLNDQPATEVDLRKLVKHVTQNRIEKLVWLAADRRVTYGEVTSLISELQSDTPDLHIAIATEAQVGPVDPLEIERMGGKRADGTLIGVMPCVSADLRP